MVEIPREFLVNPPSLPYIDPSESLADRMNFVYAPYIPKEALKMNEQNEDPGPATLFDDKLLAMILDARRTCSNQWPNQDSPASALTAIHEGVTTGLDELATTQEMVNELGPNYTKAMQAAVLWKQMADIRKDMLTVWDSVYSCPGGAATQDQLRTFEGREKAIQEDLDAMTKEPERRQTDPDEELARRLGNNDSPQEPA